MKVRHSVLAVLPRARACGLWGRAWYGYCPTGLSGPVLGVGRACFSPALTNRLRRTFLLRRSRYAFFHSSRMSPLAFLA